MNTISTIEIHSFSQPVNPTLHWLGPHRLRVLHLRDRLIPWQMRHFYYHHETQTRLGVRLSLGITIAHLFNLMLQTIANMCRLPYVSPTDVFQAGAILLPGLSSIARRISLPRGKKLYEADQPANDVMLLAEGYGRLCMEQGAGRYLTVGLVAPGDLFGEEALLDVPERESSFETVLNSQVDIISRAAFTQLVNDNPHLLRAITEHLAQRLLIQQRHMARLAFEPLDRRLAWMLIELATATNTIAHPEPTIPIYHKDLAALLGVWRETITATLNRWAAEGLIVQHAGQIVLKDLQQLRKMADEAD